MSNNFRVGQKVVCVTDHWRGATKIFPIRGHIYTVAEIRPSGNTQYEDPNEPGLILTEIPRQHTERYVVEGWGIKGFRPAVERGTESGMAILRKIAKGRDKNQEAKAAALATIRAAIALAEGEK